MFELQSVFSTVMKYFLSMLLALACYIVYSYIIKPYYIRYKYAKYPNVAMSKHFQPFIGEHQLLRDNIRKNRYPFYFTIETSLENPDYDIRLTFTGTTPLYYLCSAKALKQFISLSPTKIDRFDYMSKSIGRVNPGSLDQLQTTSEWKKRREFMMKSIGVHFASRYMPLMIEKFEEESNKWKLNEWFDLLLSMRNVTFGVITQILFGKGIIEKFGSHDYTELSGTTVKKNLQQFFTSAVIDCTKNTKYTINILFPALIKANMFHPNNVTHKNIKTLWREMARVLNEIDDQNSVYSQMLVNDPGVDRTKLLYDLLFFYFAAHDTTSHSVCCCYYYIKKYSKCYERLTSDIQAQFKYSNRSDDVKPLMRLKNINDIDYLHYIIKETLRYDSPVFSSLGYRAMDDVEI